MSKARDFLDNAARCEQLCAASLTPSSKEALRKAATTWRQLARDEGLPPTPTLYPSPIGPPKPGHP